MVLLQYVLHLHSFKQKKKKVIGSFRKLNSAGRSSPSTHPEPDEAVSKKAGSVRNGALRTLRS